jgi:putative flippase GtrA
MATLNRFMRFAFLGLVPTAAYYFFSISFVETGILEPSFALPLGFVAAVMISYQLNKKFTWKPETPRNRHFQLYLLISILGALTNYLLYALIVQLLEQSYLYAILAVTFIIPVQNFLLNEKFNFK